MTGPRSTTTRYRRTAEDRAISGALRALDAGNPRPMIDAAASGLVPTDAPCVERAWALWAELRHRPADCPVGDPDAPACVDPAHRHTPTCPDCAR